MHRENALSSGQSAGRLVLSQVLLAHSLHNFGILRRNVTADYFPFLDAVEFGSFRWWRVGFVVKYEAIPDVESGVAFAAQNTALACLVTQQAHSHTCIVVLSTQQVKDRRNNIHMAAWCIELFFPAVPVLLQNRAVKDERDVDSFEVTGAEGNAGMITNDHDQGLVEIWQATTEPVKESFQARIHIMKSVELALAKWSGKALGDYQGEWLVDVIS